MPRTLHQADEETDTGIYQDYLRAQSDADLLDIVRHLDPARYPARLDNAERELRRRHVLHLPAYSVAEYNIRLACVAAFVLSAATLALSALLSDSDARLLSAHGVTTLQDGMRVSRIVTLMLLTCLQAVVTAGLRLGAYPLLLAALLWWALTRAPLVRRRQARADVWRLVLGASIALLLSVLVACGPQSALPDLFGPVTARGLTLFDPFAMLP